MPRNSSSSESGAAMPMRKRTAALGRRKIKRRCPPTHFSRLPQAYPPEHFSNTRHRFSYLPQSSEPFALQYAATRKISFFPNAQKIMLKHSTERSCPHQDFPNIRHFPRNITFFLPLSFYLWRDLLFHPSASAMRLFSFFFSGSPPVKWINHNKCETTNTVSSISLQMSQRLHIRRLNR